MAPSETNRKNAAVWGALLLFVGVLLLVVRSCSGDIAGDRSIYPELGGSSPVRHLKGDSVSSSAKLGRRHSGGDQGHARLVGSSVVSSFLGVYQFDRNIGRALDDQGRLTPLAIREFEMSKEDVVFAEAAMASAFESFRLEVADRVRVEDNGVESVVAFDASPDRGFGRVKELYDDLSQGLTDDVASGLIRALPLYEYFGGFGQFNVSIAVSSVDGGVAPRSPRAKVVISLNDPDSGKTVFRSSATWQKVQKCFPGLLKIDQ